MGQTYSVSLTLKFKDKAGAAQALRAKISRAGKEKVLYGLDHYKYELGIGTDTIDDLLKIFFGGWEGKLHDTGTTLESGFDASYGWESVMMEAFEDMAPFLEDESEIKIYPDSGHDHGIVEAGAVTWS